MFLIDYKDRRPIYEQMVEKMKDYMVRGIWEPDSQLPSVRSMAVDLSINPNTIQRAYAELERQGFIYSVKGKGSFVSAITEIREAKLEEIRKSVGAIAIEALAVGLKRNELTDMVIQAYEEVHQSMEHKGGQV